jgi:hypothetical protein
MKEVMMAKIKKRKLRWKASESRQVVGYRLYWAEGETVDYDAPFATLGNVTEVVLPDDVEGFAPKSGPVAFGISAVDELGNESDLVIFKAPFQFNVPLPPEEFWIESLETGDAEEPAEDDDEAPETSEPIALFVKGARHADADDETETVSPEEGEKEEYRTVQHYGYPENEVP